MNSELKSSSTRIGQLYPILVDSNGEIIDGQHRFQADKTWRKVVLENIRTEKDRLVARIVANNVRRRVSQGEKQDLLNELGSLLQRQGIPPGRIGRSIAEETGMSYRWVMKYLSRKFKDDLQSRRASVAARYAAEIYDNSYSLPKKDTWIEIKRYVNTKFVVVTIEKKFYAEFEKTCLEIGVSIETSIANALEEYHKKMKRAVRHKA
jgi:hypothetical protein